MHRVNREELADAYGILCQSLALNGAPPDHAPFGFTYCVIPPLGRTTPHRHFDGEYFFILSGTGEIEIARSVRPISALELVRIPNHSNHTLSNLSKTEELHFLSIYWDKPGHVPETLPENTLVLPAPPTPNGKLHVGHLSGPYLAADVLGKYLRLRKKNARVVCGSDENQSYVPFKGWQENRTALAVMEDYTKSIQGILKDFRVELARYVEPHRLGQEYTAFVQRFYETLVDKNFFFRKKVGAPFSPKLGSFVHEAYISGGCPHCQKPTNGNGCEACGLYNDALDLKNPRCNVTGGPIEYREVEKVYFDLTPFRERLLEAVSRSSLSPDMREFSQKLIREGLTEISVTFPGTWGIPAPDREGQIIYEWVEMAANYLFHAVHQSPTGNYLDYWGEAGTTVLSFGVDNSYNYMALVPALLWAYDERIQYPNGFLVNQFFLLEGKKFSTSRRHAIWGDEILESDLVEALRIYLAAQRPEGRETDFSLADFKSFIECTLISEWDSLFAKIEAFSQGTNGTVFQLDSRDRAFLRDIELAIEQAETYYHHRSFSLNEVYRALGALVRRAHAYLASCEPLSGNSREVATLLLGTAVKALAQILEPLAPEMAKSYRERIGVQNAAWETHPEPLSTVELTPFERFGEKALQAFDALRLGKQ